MSVFHISISRKKRTMELTSSEVGIYKKTRKHAFGQESDQEKKEKTITVKKKKEGNTFSTKKAIKKKREKTITVKKKKERKHVLDQESHQEKTKNDNSQEKKKKTRYRPRKSKKDTDQEERRKEVENAN